MMREDAYKVIDVPYVTGGTQMAMRLLGVLHAERSEDGAQVTAMGCGATCQGCECMRHILIRCRAGGGVLGRGHVVQ